MKEYDFVREASDRRRSGLKPGDPKAAAQALMAIVDAGPRCGVFSGPTRSTGPEPSITRGC
jgi:hypothetical protein